MPSPNPATGLEARVEALEAEIVRLRDRLDALSAEPT
jgi:uncharacterized protein YceH (UPF0502 family)